MTASSQKVQYPAHHGLLGRDGFWCSEEEKTSYIEIRFPMKYMITGARIQLKRKYRIKAMILKVQLFDQWINFHQYKVTSLIRTQLEFGYIKYRCFERDRQCIWYNSRTVLFFLVLYER